MENSEFNVEEIDQVVIILQQLNIPATYENMSRLMCCLQLLATAKNKIAKIGTAEVDQNAADGDK